MFNQGHDIVNSPALLHSTRTGHESPPGPLPHHNLVLCVDKDPGTRETIQAALPGDEIEFVFGADAAVRNLNARAYDLYILEYWLPDWTGTSLCREIRKTDPHVPICFHTAATQPQDRQRAQRAGANAYILKPAKPEQLKTDLQTLIQSRASEELRARGIALAGMRQELKQRLTTLRDAKSYSDLKQALERISEIKAKRGFLAAGGTLAGFQRAWPLLWQQAWLYGSRPSLENAGSLERRPDKP